jgi:hypothetical protein
LFILFYFLVDWQSSDSDFSKSPVAKFVGRDITIAQSSNDREEVMRNTSLMYRFWLNAGLSLSVAGMPWTTTIGLFGTTTIATLTAAPSAQAAMLSGWDFDPSSQELTITVPGGTTPRYFLAAEPARIVLDLPNTDIGTVPLEQTYGGAIRAIRVAQFEPGVTRIVLELAPGTVLAPGQVDLQQVDAGTGQGDRWVLRPLLAGDAPVASSTSSTMPSSPVATPPTPTEAIAIPTPPVSNNAAPFPNPTETSTTATATPDATSVTAELPPLEPGAMEIPVEGPAQATVTVPAPDTIAQPTPEETNAEAEAEAIDPQPVAEAQPIVPEATEDTLGSRSETNSAAQDDGSSGRSNLVRLPGPDSVPESEVGEPETNLPAEPDRSSAMAVPEIDTASPGDTPSAGIEATVTPPTAPDIAASPTLPDAWPTEQTSSPSPTVSVPPLVSPAVDHAASSEATEETAPANSIAPNSDTADTAEEQSIPASPAVAPSPFVTSSPATPTTSGPIEFGQPLPKSSYGSPDATSPQITQLPGTAESEAPNSIAYADSTNNPVLLPSGTVLSVRYPGEEPLELTESGSRQEVLVLAEAVRDEAGNVVFPQGSFVVGRFEKTEDQSQFIAQAISLQGQSVLVNAQSDGISERSAHDHLLRNSALGVAAGVVLGITGVGLIPAIAAGAATTAGITFLPGSRSANVIQPDQVLEVRLTQDLYAN